MSVKIDATEQLLLLEMSKVTVARGQPARSEISRFTVAREKP
jgi:hypothetical protein